MQETTTISNGNYIVTQTTPVAAQAVIVQANINTIQSEITNEQNVLASLQTQTTNKQNDIATLQQQLADQQALLAQLTA